MEGRIKSQRKEVDALEREVEELTHPSGAKELCQLIDENTKLKYQMHILQRAVDTEEESFAIHLAAPHSILSAVFDFSIKKVFPEIQNHTVLVTASTREAFGDYQCNSPMNLSKELKEKGIELTPRDIAKKIVDNVQCSEVIEKMEIAGPGFINIFLKRSFVEKEIRKILTRGVTPPRLMSRVRVIVDMSSPNIAKEMHVGHLRSTIIGDCIANLFQFLGHEVLKINHVGDWGTQFGMLVAHLRDIHPNYATECPPISDLQTFYKASKKRFDEDEEFKKRAYDAVVKLQSRDPEYLRGWEIICDVSRKENQKVYDRLNILNLVELGESFYQDEMVRMIADLDSRGLLKLEDGRKLFWAPNCDIPMTVVKSDGGFTYDTSDLAAIRYRVATQKADWIIYVVDMGQAVHFSCFFSGARAAGFTNQHHRIEHIGFGVVLGEDGKKFKTRSGQTIRLVDLLDEGLERALNKLKEKGRDKELTQEELELAQKAVAYSCIKYADLSHRRTNDYVFSFDKMLDDKGNTAVYLLYAYTRISSIARTAKIDAVELARRCETEPIQLDHPKEWKLAKALVKFTDVAVEVERTLMPHTFCDYLYELSCTFTEFYDNCYCIEKCKETGNIMRINYWRILLCEATAKVMKRGFDILGITPVQRM